MWVTMGTNMWFLGEKIHCSIYIPQKNIKGWIKQYGFCWLPNPTNRQINISIDNIFICLFVCRGYIQDGLVRYPLVPLVSQLAGGGSQLFPKNISLLVSHTICILSHTIITNIVI